MKGILAMKEEDLQRQQGALAEAVRELGLF